MYVDYKENKGFRLLSIYERLNKGELVSKEGLAREFGVTTKTIQRDIDDLRAYLSEIHSFENDTTIKYDRSKGKYCLMRFERECVTNEEVLSICKIMLESRAFNKFEIDTLLSKLLSQVTPNDRKHVEDIILNEKFCYVPPLHGKALISVVWELSQYIASKEVICISYKRKDGVQTERNIKPVAIMFSEYYFYLIAYMADGSKAYPTVFRVDRIEKLLSTKEIFKVPYKEKFNEGEFRKKVQFMHSGALRTVVFEYKGKSIEAVIDRLPTARILNETKGTFTVSAKVYGTGIDMWLRSQGGNVKIIGLDEDEI
jgi:predicted DNA-binding transcriptional regulator YafY